LKAVNLIVLPERSVKVGDVGWVYAPLVALKVVAVHEKLLYVPVFLRHDQGLVLREVRSSSWAQISKNNPSQLLTRIGKMPDLLMKFTAGRLSRLLHTIPMNIIEPTMIDTSQTAILHPTLAEVHPSVGTAGAKESQSSLIVTKQNEIFTQETHA